MFGLAVGSGEVLGAESSLESLWPHMEAGGYKSMPGSLSECTEGNVLTKVCNLPFWYLKHLMESTTPKNAIRSLSALPAGKCPPERHTGHDTSLGVRGRGCQCHKSGAFPLCHMPPSCDTTLGDLVVLRGQLTLFHCPTSPAAALTAAHRSSLALPPPCLTQVTVWLHLLPVFPALTGPSGSGVLQVSQCWAVLQG